MDTTTTIKAKQELARYLDALRKGKSGDVGKIDERHDVIETAQRQAQEYADQRAAGQKTRSTLHENSKEREIRLGVEKWMGKRIRKAVH